MSTFLTLFVVVFIITYYILWPFRDFFWDLPWMLWFFWEKQYILVLQNNYEKRPSWWFISSYAIIKTFLGKVEYEIKDSYDIEPPNPRIEPPYPLNELLSSDKFYSWWVFRDSNWSPDFPTSANNIISYYDKWIGKISQFDWVFAIDMEILWNLLKITWPLKVNWKNFTSDNYFYLTQILSKNIDLHNIEELKNRKSFLKPLIKSIFSYIKTHPSLIDNIMLAQKNLLDNKHILLFFSDDSLENKISLKWWWWVFNMRTEDYVHINIANIWGRKSDRYIQQINSYNVSFDKNNDAVWELKINFHHRWTKSLISDFYQAYVRIYLPKWIIIQESLNNFKSGQKNYEELNSQVVWWLIHMQPWERTEIKLIYKLPKIINSNNYGFEIIPQNWWNGELWHITSQLPSDNFWIKKCYNLNPNRWICDEISVKENLASFDWKIYNNTVFNLENIWDKIPPIIVWQRFLENNKIEINFSEEISKKSIVIWNIEINDMNISDQNSDNISILKTYSEWNSILLELKWINYQKWEYYLVKLKNIQDISWNSTDPNPINITVVQN